eukprot:307253_1
MSTESTQIEIPTEWILKCVVYLFAMAANAAILRYEIKKRRSTDTQYPSQLSKTTSLLCIISGVIASFFGLMDSFPCFCYFGTNISWVFEFFQVLFMGFYQLARLNYFFSRENAKMFGYPNWIINLMYSIGIFITFCCIIWACFGNPINCGFNKKFNILRIYSASEFELDIFFIWLNVTIIIYLLWDFGTLTLYISKLNSINKKSQLTKIKEFMTKIIILTIF